MFDCAGCNKGKDDFSVMIIRDHVIKKFCKECRTPKGVADVYFKGDYVDENIASEQYPGPKRISSRADKKYWLDKCNLREAGDRVHGATSFDKISNRYAMESLRRK